MVIARQARRAPSSEWGAGDVVSQPQSVPDNSSMGRFPCFMTEEAGGTIMVRLFPRREQDSARARVRLLAKACP